MTGKCLRDLQRSAIIEMLHFNSGAKTSSNEDIALGGGSATVNAPIETSIWKVLILDEIGQQILSPIIKVNDLRDHGVTLYLQLNSDRQSIPDVPSVYFVEPSAENIARICKDLSNNLYESFYLNFTTSIPRTFLEDLAYSAVDKGSSALIAKVFDQYLNFTTLEENLFTLNIPNTFLTLNDAKSSDSLIDSTLDRIGTSLFSVLLTIGGQPPLIFATRGTAAESLAEKLDNRIRNYLLNAKTLYLGGSGNNFSEIGIEDSLQRPLILLLDRNFDLSSLLKHTSTYNALVHDVLGINLNRVTILSEGIKKVFDIDIKDTFWQHNASLPFPTVAENVDVALNNYKSDMQQITRNSSVANLQNIDDINAASSMMTADELKTAINILPELTERKRIIDSHLQISTCLLEQIKKRDLGNLFHVEQQASSDSIKNSIIQIIKGNDATPLDKLRLFIIYYLSHLEITHSEILQFEKLLIDSGCDLSPLEYCKKMKSFMKMSAAQSSNQLLGSQSSGSGGTGGDFLSFGNRLTSGVLGNVFNSVKKLLPESADTPLTKLIETALELAMGPSSSLRSTLGGGTPKDDNFIILDPKSKDRSKPPVQRSAYNQLIVFIIGGSNYAEYNHAIEFIGKKQLKMNVTLGSTELLSGEEFLNQLSKLGNQ